MLTTEELIYNATACFAKYHLDNNGIITNYATCIEQVDWIIDELGELKITRWGYSTNEPLIADLKTTYSKEDFTIIDNLFDIIRNISFGRVIKLSTDERTIITPNALLGSIVFDTTLSEFFIYDENIWKKIITS